MLFPLFDFAIPNLTQYQSINFTQTNHQTNRGCKMANKSVVMASSLIGEAFESIDVEFSDSDSWQVIDTSDSDDGNFSYGDVTTTDDEDEVVPDVDDLLQQTYGSPVSDISMQSLVNEIAHHCQKVEDAYEIDHVGQIIDNAVVEDGGLINGEDDPYEEDKHQSEEDDNDGSYDLDDFLMRCQEVNSAYEIDHIGQITASDDGGLIDGEDDPYEEDEDHSDEVEDVDEDEDDDDDLDLDDELVPKWLNNKFERQRMRKLGKRAYPKMKKSKRLAYMYNKPGCVHGKHGLGMKHNLIW